MGTPTRLSFTLDLKIPVRKKHQCKLVVFTPAGDKYTFKVLPFGPKNIPNFYTFMMRDLQIKWDVVLSKI